MRAALRCALTLLFTGCARGEPAPAAREVAPLASPIDTAMRLPRSLSGGPTLLFARGPKLTAVDPTTGLQVEALSVPPSFHYSQLTREGAFLLVVAMSAPGPKPDYRAERLMYLFDQRGQHLWTRRDEARRHSKVYLSELGFVSFQSWSGHGVLTPDRVLLQTTAAPSGPVLHGRTDVVPLLLPPAPPRDNVSRDHLPSYRWQVLAPYGLGTILHVPPDDIVARAFHVAQRSERGVDLVAVARRVESRYEQLPMKTLATLSLPNACKGREPLVWAAVSSHFSLLFCWDERHPRAATKHFLIDADASRIEALVLPKLEHDADAKIRQHLEALPDGTVVLAHWDGCQGEAYEKRRGGDWLPSAVALPFGPPVEPDYLCGRLVLNPGIMPSNMGCGYSGGAKRPYHPRDVSYVQQRDGTWQLLPVRYRSDPNGCSHDNRFAAFVTRHVLRVASMDSPLQWDLVHDAGPDTPFAWLP